MVNIGSLLSGRSFYYTAGAVLAGATVAFYIVEEVVGNLAIRTAFEFGKFCKNQTSDLIVRELGNITCRALGDTSLSSGIAAITFIVLAPSTAFLTAAAFMHARSIKKQGTLETQSLQVNEVGL
jgi:hypothetical protein